MKTSRIMTGINGKDSNKAPTEYNAEELIN